MLTDIIHKFIKKGFICSMRVNQETITINMYIMIHGGDEFELYSTAKYPDFDTVVKDMSDKLQSIEEQGNFPL